ncbi:endoplasmic reticulum junction formation protein lunapark-A isoform X2 [Halyomorpha halys]|uniref:endoplasmic reticulum junction formation protein lunapark-A isoform X2 n=1 Tax=Halyomorpha halys TaxID=286706 RepID=UPI0006D51DFE|nr:endoplasmic reticulum junction formation protein lunapark-A isoform X2 [Halyomorpha halys]
MGLILSRFRRKKSADEILEEIQGDIQSLESDRNQVLQRQNYVVGRLIIYSVLLYVIAAALFYFCFFPASLTDRIFYMIPLLMFPLLIVLLKKFITWYYKREIIHNKDKLSDLKAKKKKILEDVMNTETYKVAKEILEKYAPEQLKKSGPEPTVKPLSSSGTNLKVPVPKDSNNIPSGPPPPQQQLQVAKLPALPAPQPSGFSPVHQKTVSPMILHRRQSSPQRMSLLEGSPQRRLVRPIIPRERNWIDRVIESIVGDGPSNRYALICKNCSSHNGMALREEFEYLAFRCAYCGFPNPSHKVKPASRPSSRSSSAERKIDDVIKQQLEDSDSSQKDKEGEQKMNITPKNNDKGVQDDRRNPLEDSEADASKSDAESDESGNPSDGIRPRKPLQVTD